MTLFDKFILYISFEKVILTLIGLWIFRKFIWPFLKSFLTIFPAKYFQARKAHKLIEEHLETLAKKERLMVITDDYGRKSTSKWEREKRYFIKNVLEPSSGKLPLSHARMSEAIDEYVRIYRQDVEDNIEIDYHPEIDPIEYEHLCANILNKNGWEARVTQASGDQGVDVIATKDGLEVALQCKKYSSPVGNKAVQEVHAAKGYFDSDIGVVVTNSSYTMSAQELAQKLDILLLHHDDLIELENKILDSHR